MSYTYTPRPLIRRFYCPYCDDSKRKSRSAQYLRPHVRNHHPEITAQELERYIVGCRYPDVDIEAIVQRYVDRLETMIGLQYQGLFLKKYLHTIGVARHPQMDKALMGVLKNPQIKTAEDVRKAFEDQLIGKFRDADPIVRFQGYLNRDISVLENKGQGDLVESIKTLKTIRFIKAQLQEAREPETTEESAEPIHT